MVSREFHLAGGVMVAVLLWYSAAPGEELPLTENVPISEFQNRTEDVNVYNFDAPPQGMFRSIATAEDFEERLGPLRTHEILPIKPTERFRTDVAAIFIVFSLHQHYQAFTVFGRCMPEQVAGVLPGTIISEDAMHIALEDESGYLKLSAPKTSWKPGRYKVEIHAGEQVNEMSLMGTMRFTIVASGK
ncbi:MAG: hypothetical protein Nkreftii_003833 [Candidatus Nitrospira kreftii]|jgi:hypothetical protein|uniref:Uncharacterized protein n=1 Tax=Candidatus Nitrospira kreftii TaxID=2652173 RepID=A0A7S8J1V8_9BACT|nr:MAG: hypothetical protein Nkreftii_003833 [Candidatus Nitrospira kreftii]